MLKKTISTVVHSADRPSETLSAVQNVVALMTP
jgi:hypothetical protein